MQTINCPIMPATVLAVVWFLAVVVGSALTHFVHYHRRNKPPKAQ